MSVNKNAPSIDPSPRGIKRGLLLSRHRCLLAYGFDLLAYQGRSQTRLYTPTMLHTTLVSCPQRILSFSLSQKRCVFIHAFPALLWFALTLQSPPTPSYHQERSEHHAMKRQRVETDEQWVARPAMQYTQRPRSPRSGASSYSSYDAPYPDSYSAPRTIYSLSHSSSVFAANPGVKAEMEMHSEDNDQRRNSPSCQPAQCDICGKKLSRAGDMPRHKKTHLKDKKAVYVFLALSVPSQRLTHTCPFMQSALLSFMQLQQHSEGKCYSPHSNPVRLSSTFFMTACSIRITARERNL